MLNHQVVLVSRPEGWVTPANFRFQEAAIPSPGPGQVLIQNHWLSLDPYMRGRISEAKSYARSVNIGDVMVGGAVGEVIASNAPKFSVGDTVLAASGWQLFAAMDASAVTPIRTDKVSPSAYLGVLGMPGITAWTGLIDICQPREGETVVVDAASGAVGSVVGQLAKLQGCRVVGIAGGTEKCRYVAQELGFDACIDHRSAHFASELAAALPSGIDCLFENVGGEIFERLLSHMNVSSRIALCGMVSEFNREPYANRTLRSILINRIRIQGFIVSDKLETWPSIRDNLYDLVVQEKLKFRESVTVGLENAPAAFIGLLKGENFGKQLIKLR
ncbi:MAG: NADP-dependent oxidoreductase [Burkholderiaceae bacterium]|nr:NADP-dependent oxidoreductase [Burkholderiaceae bacterium]